MNGLERTKAIWNFKQPDYYPVPPLHPWHETILRWEKQGLPKGTEVNAYFGITQWDVVVPPVNLGLQPAFDVKLLSDNGEKVIVRDELGVTKSMLKADYLISNGLLSNAGQTGAMSHWLEYPVKSLYDWDKLYEEKLLIDFDKRFPQRLLNGNTEDFARDKAVLVHNFPLFGGLGAVRQLMGYEQMVFAMYDEPRLIEKIMQNLCEHWMRVFKKLFELGARVDGVVFFEDMCSSKGPLLSPEMYMRFFGPAYKELNKFLKQNNVFWREVDSDGNISLMIETWRECGINTVSPCQARCGFTTEQLALQYPDIVFKGGIDKEILALSKPQITQELERAFKLAQTRGGYQPLLDHSIPPHVPLENIAFYVEEYKRLGKAL